MAGPVGLLSYTRCQAAARNNRSTSRLPPPLSLSATNLLTHHPSLLIYFDPFICLPHSQEVLHLVSYCVFGLSLVFLSESSFKNVLMSDKSNLMAKVHGMKQPFHSSSSSSSSELSNRHRPWPFRNHRSSRRRKHNRPCPRPNAHTPFWP
jgi:hypothetical protein